jgi:hypothetical protein
MGWIGMGDGGEKEKWEIDGWMIGWSVGQSNGGMEWTDTLNI